MKSRYFCAHHAELMKHSENAALSHWSQAMQRGIKAYMECRLEAAQIYLEAAFEIALMRSQCLDNKEFSESRLLKPAEFLLQVYLNTNEFDWAYELLHRINKANDANPAFFDESLFDFLGKSLERVEVGEKDFFGGSGTGAKKPFANNATKVRWAPSAAVYH